MRFSKYLFSFLLISFSAINSFGQNKNGDTKREEIGFINYEVLPFWKACTLDSMSMDEQRNCTNESLLEFIYGNLKMPKNLCYSGRVIVQILIQKDGKVSNFKFLKNYPEPIKREVKKVFDKMPDWIPGTRRGIPVDVHYNIPIRFDLT